MKKKSIIIGTIILVLAVTWVAGHKAFITQPYKYDKACIMLLTASVEMYLDHFDKLPKTETGILDFGEKLSKIQPNKDWQEKRPMFINFKTSDFSVSNDNYDAPNAEKTIVYDKRGTPFHYIYDTTNQSFRIVGAGQDKTIGTKDDISID